MAITTVNQTDTFDQWRVKCNTVSTSVGDLVILTTTANSDAVGAINELDGEIGSLTGLQGGESTVVSAINGTRSFSIAMSIALG